MVTQTFRIESFKLFSDDGLIALVTIEHPDLPQPIRLAWYDKDVTSRGDVYSAFPMRLELPTSGDRNVTARLVLLAPAVELVPVIRSLDEFPTVKIELVRINDPDTVEDTFDNLVIKAVEIDEEISGELVPETNLERRFPKDGIHASNIPGSFA